MDGCKGPLIATSRAHASVKILTNKIAGWSNTETHLGQVLEEAEADSPRVELRLVASRETRGGLDGSGRQVRNALVAIQLV